jgi:hypothetical protein
LRATHLARGPTSTFSCIDPRHAARRAQRSRDPEMRSLHRTACRGNLAAPGATCPSSYIVAARSRRGDLLLVRTPPRPADVPAHARYDDRNESGFASTVEQPAQVPVFRLTFVISAIYASPVHRGTPVGTIEEPSSAPGGVGPRSWSTADSARALLWCQVPWLSGGSGGGCGVDPGGPPRPFVLHSRAAPRRPARRATTSDDRRMSVFRKRNEIVSAASALCGGATPRGARQATRPCGGWVATPLPAR